MILKNESDVSLLSIIKNERNWRGILSDKCVSVYNLPNNRVMVMYGDITRFDKSLPWMLETRGPVIDLDTLDYVCRPFDKFWNFKEGNIEIIDELDWNNTIYYEKLDGSLIKLWYDFKENKWMISTNRWHDAYVCKISEKFRNNKYDINTLGQLLDYTLNKNYKDFDIDSLDKNSTHMFELCTPLNRVVVKHNEFKLFYLGSRVNHTGEEYKIDISIPSPKIYNFSDFKDCLSTTYSLPISSEGYVLHDISNNIRVKCKSVRYVAIHHLLSEDNRHNPKFQYRAVKSREMSEIIAYIPDIKDEIMDMDRRYLNMVKYLEDSLSESEKLINEMGPRAYSIIGKKFKYNVHIFEIIKLKRFTDLNHYLSECVDYKMASTIEAFNK